MSIFACMHVRVLVCVCVCMRLSACVWVYVLDCIGVCMCDAGVCKVSVICRGVFYDGLYVLYKYVYEKK